jgi:integrase
MLNIILWMVCFKILQITKSLTFKTAFRRAKIKDFRFHDLRHTFASHLAMASVDIMTVKELLGYKSLNMTMRYAHLAPAHKVKALEMFDLQFNNQVYGTIERAI